MFLKALDVSLEYYPGLLFEFSPEIHSRAEKDIQQ